MTYLNISVIGIKFYQINVFEKDNLTLNRNINWFTEQDTKPVTDYNFLNH